MADATVIDFSFGHAQITPAAMRKVDGCVGGIGYAGCLDNGKNITRAEYQALVGAGFWMGLVIEDNTTDLANGAGAGRSQGNRIVAGAHTLGHPQGGLCSTGYDTDAHSGDYANILAGAEAFAAVVTAAGFQPGYYGDSDSIDFLFARHPDWFFWQSDSASFSPKNPTPNANIRQLFNDPRAHGLPVDVNVMVKGLDDMPTVDDFWNTHTVTLADGTVRQMDTAVAMAVNDAAAAVAAVNSLKPLITAANDSADIQRVQSSIAVLASTIAALSTKVDTLSATVQKITSPTANVDLAGASFPATVTVQAPK